jgi:hypothetical protein
LRSPWNARSRAVRRALGPWSGRFGNERAYSLARVAGEERARRREGAGGSGEVELFARAGRCGAWRLGGQSEVREDLAHDDRIGELRDEAAWAATVRAGQEVEGEDAAQ